MKKQIFSTKAIVEIAIFAAIAFVLDFLQGEIWDLTPIFPAGGSIGIAMLPVMIIALRRGVISGGICGLIVGLLQMLSGVYAIGLEWYNVMFQVMLDYTLPYVFTGLLTGIFYHVLPLVKNKTGQASIVAGACFLGGFGKFMSHFMAGAIYWQSTTGSIYNQEVEYASASIYSLLYNGSYCLPSTIICMVLAYLIFFRQPKFFIENYSEVAA